MEFEKDQRFGKVVLLNETVKVGRRWYQKVRCDCGTERLLRNDRFPNVYSCGCHRRNKFGLPTYDYELLYGVWRNMIKRCYDKTSKRYYTYGAKGISVCEKWKNSFYDFADWAVSNGWQKGLSIERKDVNLNYCEENCTFIPMKLQGRNKRNNVRFTIDGENKCVSEWCEFFGISDKLAYSRIYRGYTDPCVIFYKGDLRELRV